jgi:putative FMN-dependent luciferase-like monooxygenase
MQQQGSMTHSETPTSKPFRLGVFTRLVDRDVAAPVVYARALELFETAEQLGFETAWVAQHHVRQEGGLPAPLVFLAHAAARTSRLRLATGIITLPLEQPLRLAEDAAVLNVLSGGRFELGFGTGGNANVFSRFGHALEERQADYDRAFDVVRGALAGEPIGADGSTLWPPAADLAARVWEASFGVPGAVRAAEHGSGLLLSRTAQRAGEGVHRAPLGEVQLPVVEAYLERCAARGVKPRIGLSRSIYVADSRAEALADAEPGMRRFARVAAAREGIDPNLPTPDLLARSDVHIGSPTDVVASLRADRLLALATDLVLQVHPVDPPHASALRSFRLIASEVAPALGWSPLHEDTPAASDQGSIVAAPVAH